MKVDQLDIVIESDESDEFLSRFESSFGMTYEEMGISNGMSLQDVIDRINARLGRESSRHCTSQSLFFRVRNILVNQMGLQKNMITPSARLGDILPKTTRRRDINLLEGQLGIRIQYYQAPGWIQWSSMAFLLMSFILLFSNFSFGVMGVVGSLVTISMAHKFSKSLPFKTFGEFINKIRTDNLIKLQSNEGEINEREIKGVLIDLIRDLHGIEEHEIDFKQRLVFA